MYRLFNKVLVSLTICTLLLAGSALAEPTAGTFSLSPSIGYHLMDSSLSLDDAVVFGLGIGYNFSSAWSLETDFRYTPAETETANSIDVDIWTISLGGLYNFNPDATFNPYITFGGGLLAYEADGTDSGDEDVFGYYGVGLKYSLTKSTDLRFDARHLLDYRSDNRGNTQGEDDWASHVQATFGLTYKFNLFH